MRGAERSRDAATTESESVARTVVGEGGVTTDEATTTPQRAPPQRKAAVQIPQLVELVAYVGAAFALFGELDLASRAGYGTVPAGTFVGAFVGTTLLMWVVGALVDETADPSYRRVRGTVWLIATLQLSVGAPILAAAWVGGEIAGWSYGASVACISMAIWRFGDRPVQQFGTAVGVVIAMGFVAEQSGAPFGVAIWLVGVVWLAAGLRDLFPPQWMALFIGTWFTIAGALLVEARVSGPGRLFAVATTGAVLAVGLRTDRSDVIWRDVIGLLAVVSVTAPFYVASFAKIAIGVTGSWLVLLVAVLVRSGHHGHASRTSPPPPPPPPFAPVEIPDVGPRRSHDRGLDHGGTRTDQPPGDAPKRALPREEPAQNVPAFVEVGGYVGLMFAIVCELALASVAFQLGTPPVALLAVFLGTTAVTWIAGALVDETADRSYRRLRGALWLIATLQSSVLVTPLASDRLGVEAGVAYGISVACISMAIWRFGDRPAQQLGTAVGIAIVLGFVADRADLPAGVAIWLLGVVWLAAGLRDLGHPRPTALIVGTALTIGGALVGGAELGGAGELFAPTTVIALLVVAVVARLRRRDRAARDSDVDALSPRR